jgi:hypothetical protein
MVVAEIAEYAENAEKPPKSVRALLCKNLMTH